MVLAAHFQPVDEQVPILEMGTLGFPHPGSLEDLGKPMPLAAASVADLCSEQLDQGAHRPSTWHHPPGSRRLSGALQGTSGLYVREEPVMEGILEAG